MSKIAPDHASSKIWFPEIDGMRAVAAILVVFHHYQGQVFGTYSAANLSVSAFFVISGFLIYYLAEVESRKTGKMRLGKYFFRRILRIWPMYFFTVFLSLALYGRPGIDSELKILDPSLSTVDFLNTYSMPIWTFTINWAMSFNFLYSFYHWSPGQISILWSICVEEQFYLLFPLVFIFIRGRFFAPYVLIGIFVFSVVAVFLFVQIPPNHQNPSSIGSSSGVYYFTFSYVPMFIMGGVAAWMFLNPERSARFAAIISMKPLIFIYFGGLVFTGYIWNSAMWLPYVWYTPLIYVALTFLFFFIIVWIMNNRSGYVAAFLSAYPVRVLGMLSFSLYCTHMISALLFGYHVAGGSQRFSEYLDYGLLNNFLMLVFAIAFSALAHGLVERPFLVLKNRNRPQSTQLSSTTVPWLATSILLFGLALVGRVTLYTLN